MQQTEKKPSLRYAVTVVPLLAAPLGGEDTALRDFAERFELELNKAEEKGYEVLDAALMQNRGAVIVVNRQPSSKEAQASNEDRGGAAEEISEVLPDPLLVKILGSVAYEMQARIIKGGSEEELQLMKKTFNEDLKGVGVEVLFTLIKNAVDCIAYHRQRCSDRSCSLDKLLRASIGILACMIEERKKASVC